jgi:putative hydrolase of the HAD superfamily
MADSRFVALFSDIGGVLGTNGWDTALRLKIARQFNCDTEEIQMRHRMMFDSYERGYMTFEQYLRRVFFASPRDFTLDDVRQSAFNESVPWIENISLLRRIKIANGLKLALISNEGEGLTEYRARKFGLRELADFMVFSHFVHRRKPDLEMWHLALNLAQVEPAETIYIDDREIFVEVAAELGFTAIQHVSLDATRGQLQQLGLAAPDQNC